MLQEIYKLTLASQQLFYGGFKIQGRGFCYKHFFGGWDARSTIIFYRILMFSFGVILRWCDFSETIRIFFYTKLS